MTHFMNKPAPPGGEVLLAGRPVARVGYGVMQLAERPGRAPLPADEAIAILRRAVEMGVNHFDTAQFYGAGLANEHTMALTRLVDACLMERMGQEAGRWRLDISLVQRTRVT